MSDDLDRLREHLAREQAVLDAIVAGASDEQWHRPTPSPGWNVGDQIAHLAYFDESAALAACDPDGFLAHRDDLIAGAVDHGVDEFTLRPFRALTPKDVLASWRNARADLADAAASLDEQQRLPWYGPTMSARSFLGARLMETWAHGVDVADALGVPLAPTDRLYHVADLGFRTRRWSYRVRGEEPPVEEVRVTLLGPGGDTWNWGPTEADHWIEGSAEEFCLVVAQRRHVDDTSLSSSELGYRWLVRAQVFAGAPSSYQRTESV
jgi:uncharacterized protein (TIGR03084 family)